MAQACLSPPPALQRASSRPGKDRGSTHSLLSGSDGAHTLGFVHLLSIDRVKNSLGTSRGTALGRAGTAAVSHSDLPSLLHQLQHDLGAPGCWPRLLQQLPPLSHPGILIAEGHELKAPEETQPSSAKSSEDKPKDKAGIILTLQTEAGRTL